MKPNKWGPYIWYLIHTITYFIPDDNYFNKFSNEYFIFLNSLKSLIPCPKCRKHLTTLMNKNNIKKCKNKDEIINWCLKIHNEVNKKLGKKILHKTKVDNIYKNIDIKRIINAIDLLVFNFQYKFPINQYKLFFQSLRIVFPNEKFREIYKKGMKTNNIKVVNHNTLIKWYMNLGKYISKNL